ncbi:MAG: tetratricopeptide repeat protein [Halobacteriovoraceae bacterium]|nr:tetratricopeptide repeat protein [Halobacteriovoraceae bacterium]
MDRTIKDLLREHYIVAFLMLGVSLILFIPSIHYGFFIFDDPAQITDNDYMQEVGISKLLGYWKFSKTPLIFNVWQVIAKFFGTSSAAPFRLMNIIFHGLNGFLIVYVLRKILLHFDKEDNIVLPSLLGGLYFLIHPCQVESVVWVSNLRGILSTTFGLGTIALYFQLSTEESLFEKNIVKYFYVFTFYLLGLLIKPGIAAIPGLFILFDYFLYKRRWKEIAYRNSPFLILAFIYSIIHLISTFKNYYISAPFFKDRILIALDSIKFYLVKAVLPFDLSFNYQRSAFKIAELMKEPLELTILIVATLTLITLLSFFFLKKKYKPVFYGIVIFLILISVNLGFIPFVFQNVSTVADRYFYLPLIGFSLVFAWFSVIANRQQKKINKVFCYGFIGIFFGLLFGTSLRQTRHWSQSHKILRQAYNQSTESYVINVSLANAYFNNGNLEKAEEVLLEARVFAPTSSEIYSNLLKVYQHMGKLTEISYVLTELKRKKVPLTYELRLELANTYALRTEYKKSFDMLHELIVDFPNMIDTESHFNILKENYLNEKVEHFKSLSLMYKDEGNIKESDKYLKLANRVKRESMNIYKAINLFKK